MTRAAHFVYRTHEGAIRLEDTETGLVVIHASILEPHPDVCTILGVTEPIPHWEDGDEAWEQWYVEFEEALERWVGPNGFIHDPEAEVTCRPGRVG